MHGGGHNGSLAHVHDAMHLAVTLNHYGLLRVADQRIVAFEPPVAPGRVEPPFEGDSPVLLRSDIQEGPGKEIAEESRREMQEEGAEDIRPYCSCALRLPLLVEWYLTHVLRLPMLGTALGQHSRRRAMDSVRKEKRNPRVFTLASTYACFLQEGGMGREAAEEQAESFTSGATGSVRREVAMAAQRLRLQGEMPHRAAQMVVSGMLQLGRAARDALVGGLNEETLMPEAVHLADPVARRMEPEVLAGAIRDAAKAVRTMGYDNEAITLHCAACDGLGALEVVAESLCRAMQKASEEAAASRPEDGPGPQARTMAMLTKVAERLLSASPLSRIDMADGMAAMQAGVTGARTPYASSSSASSAVDLGAAGAVEARELASRRRALE